MQDNNFSELEDMRAQLALLKNKLDNETLVSDKLLRSSIKDRLKKIRRDGYVCYIAAAALIVIAPNMVKVYDISWWLAGYTILMMLVCAFFTYYYNRGLNSNMMNGSMVDVAKRMRRLRRDYKRWRYIGYPMGLVWVVWMFLELVASDANLAQGIGAAVGLLTGALIGGLVGYFNSKKTMNNIEELISDAEEFDNNK